MLNYKQELVAFLDSHCHHFWKNFHTVSEFLLSLVKLEVQDASFYPLVTGSLDFCTADLFSAFSSFGCFPSIFFSFRNIYMSESVQSNFPKFLWLRNKLLKVNTEQAHSTKDNLQALHTPWIYLFQVI